jgi:protease PrsW
MSGTALIYAILSGLLPSFIWLWFWVREDRLHPEPRSLLVACFFGGLLAVIVAVFAEKYIASIYTDSTTRYALWAAAEEILKFIAVAVIALRSKENNEPIDAMIYCIVVALGFAALENALFIMGPLSGGEIAKSIVTGNMRFMGATLLHVVSTATIGFCIGYVFYHGKLAKILAAIIGLGGAIVIHTAFNLSIIEASPADTLKTFSWIWGAVVIMIILFEEIKVVRPKLW